MKGILNIRENDYLYGSPFIKKSLIFVQINPTAGKKYGFIQEISFIVKNARK